MRRAEYREKAEAFRARLLSEAEKPPHQQVWPEPDEWLSVEGTSTCTTPICRAFNQPFPVILHENADGIYRAQCGVCLQPAVAAPTLEND